MIMSYVGSTLHLRQVAPFSHTDRCTCVQLLLQDAVPAAAKGAPRAEGIDTQLGGARVAWLDARTALIGTSSGQLLAATLAPSGGAVHRIQVQNCNAPQSLYEHEAMVVLPAK